MCKKSLLEIFYHRIFRDITCGAESTFLFKIFFLPHIVSCLQHDVVPPELVPEPVQLRAGDPLPVLQADTSCQAGAVEQQHVHALQI
jgi:hypothetical protein